MSYFFSQPDAADEPTIWLETGESDALPMLQFLQLGRGMSDVNEDRNRLWALIEKAIGTTDAGMTDPAALIEHAQGKRERALKFAETYVAETVPSTAPLNARGYPIDGWKTPSAPERLGLVLRTARFLLGEEE